MCIKLEIKKLQYTFVFLFSAEPSLVHRVFKNSHFYKGKILHEVLQPGGTLLK